MSVNEWTRPWQQSQEQAQFLQGTQQTMLNWKGLAQLSLGAYHSLPQHQTLQCGSPRGNETNRESEPPRHRN